MISVAQWELDQMAEVKQKSGFIKEMMAEFTVIRPALSKHCHHPKIVENVMSKFETYIKDSYKDLSNPNYKFVSNALKIDLYKNLSVLIADAGFTVVDDTDPNSDVCRTFIVTKDKKTIFIKISFFGPFAAIFTPAESFSNISIVQDIIQHSGLFIVDHELLNSTYAMNLTDIDGQPTLYNVLFSTDDMPI